MGSCAVAAAIHGSDAGSKSLDFVPVPGRETVVGFRAVAAATHGSDAGSKSKISYRCPVAKPTWVLALQPQPPTDSTPVRDCAPVPSRDAGSKSLNFVPVPEHEAVTGSFAVAAAIHGFEAAMPAPKILYWSPRAYLLWVFPL